MMAMAEPPSSSSLLPLLESLEDSAAGQSGHTDAYLTIANRLSGEEGRQFLPAVEKHFSRLGKAILAHITSPNVELSQAALQALGFCVYHSQVVSGVPEAFAAEILSALCSLVMKSTDKNTCTRALWVISKQSFPPDVVNKKVLSILGTLESVWSREDIQSVVMEHEALNVVIRMLEQVPAQMGDGVVRWAKLVIPLVVHSASKVRLRAAAAIEMGMPLLLEKQTEVAAIIEPLMSSKLIPELQKLFMSKNETNVLKLWPLFVKLLGKLLHRGGPFINSLLHLEELGFRSSSPTVKKIAFIAWKSLIDNFSLNPDILCSSKRIKLLMQPLTSINVRTEALLLTKVEVWWYLVVQLGPNLSPNFDQVSMPLLQCTIGCDSFSVPGTPSRAVTQNGSAAPCTPKIGVNSPANTSRMSLNSSVVLPSTFPSIQLLGLEMLLHYFLGPDAVAAAAKGKLTLSLEPLNHPLISGASSFTKHAAVLTSNVRDGFTNIGKDAPDSLLAVIWASLVNFVNLTIESGSKKDRQASEVLTLMLQALQSIVSSEALSADKILVLFEATVKGIPARVLGSASYQVGKMDLLNGTPALFLILLLYNSSMLSAYIEEERFFQCLQTLVGCGLSGHTSPLAFAEAVLGAFGGCAQALQNKEQLWRMWSVMVAQLTDSITQSNEVNQGDALEHNFSAMHSALLFPITHLLCGAPLQQVAQKSLLSTWSKLYKVFARCSALVVTAEENICCEELCVKMTASMEAEAWMVPSTLNVVASFLQVMVECVDFSPYSPQFQQKLKSPHTPVNWMKKRNKTVGNLSTFQSLLVQCLDVYLEDPAPASEATGVALVSILSTLFTNLILSSAVQEALSSLIRPLTLFYKDAASEPPAFTPQLLAKMEKLLCEVLGCIQSRSALAFNDELLALLSPLLCVLLPHKNKQLRTLVTQFWNSTFANSVSLAYPDEIRPVLSQVKQKTPIILPGFDVVTMSDEHSGQYSSECSQLETKLSGMPVSSGGKRDLMLIKAIEQKDGGSTKTSKPVSLKLDFGSPKPPRREVLEEEASIDFVFIPPEAKERVLTEHQKEVKRTKRVDIPAMYNNLDASLDTTVFTQYSQSQDDSSEKISTEQADQINKEASGKILQEHVETEENKETQDYASPKEAENYQQKEMISESSDVSVVEEAKSGEKAEDMDTQSEEDTSPKIAGSSELVSGTPQKPNSRRQSFITLEKYAEGKPASPSSASLFTGPLRKTLNSQELSDTNKTSSSSLTSTPSSQGSPSTQTEKKNSQHPVNNATESPRRPKDSGIKSEPVRLTERLPSDTTEDEDVIPDTQTEAELSENTKMVSTSEEMQLSSQEEGGLDDSQSSVIDTSPFGRRRSGRQKGRTLLPGENPDEQEEKKTKRRRSGQEPKSDSQKSSSAPSRLTRRSMQAAEDGGRERLQTRAQKEKSENSQTNSQGRAHKKIKLYSGSDELLDKPRRRSTREKESSQSDPQSDSESQSKGRRHLRSRTSLDTDEESAVKKKDLAEGPEGVKQTVKDDHELKNDSRVVTPSPQRSGRSQEFDLVQQIEKDDDILQKETPITILTPQANCQSQQCELVENTKKEKRDSSTVASSPTKLRDGTHVLVTESEANDERGADEGIDDGASQEEESDANTPSLSESQARRRSKRSKASSEAVESEDKIEGRRSVGRPSRFNSKSAVSQPETGIGGRTRRSKVHEALSSPNSTPEGSQSLDVPEKSSKGRGKYLRRKSSPASAASPQSSESESSQTKDVSKVPKKRGRKPRASLPSPLTCESKENTIDSDVVNNVVDDSQEVATQSIEPEMHESQQSRDLQDAESFQVTPGMEQQCNEDSQVEVDADLAVENVSPETDDTTQCTVSRVEKAPGNSGTNADHASSQESDTGDSGKPDPVGISNEEVEEDLPSDPSAADAPMPHVETTERPRLSESSEDKAEEVSENGDGVDENQKDDAQRVGVPGGGTAQDENLADCPDVPSELPKEEEQSSPERQAEVGAEPEVAQLQEDDAVGKTQTAAHQGEDQTEKAIAENDGVENVDDALSDFAVSADFAREGVFQDSPIKQKDLEAVMDSDIGQSPCSGKTRGTWSPTASPSNSILKKGQKRPLEEDSPSPLVKSRRVSFADPIQHQELADDIDRRSPALRTSSPRRSKFTSIPQPKFITTPTKGLLVFSPRNLRSPGSKSSKKCLISEMSQEPRPVPKDCIYPALVGCSTPVEAVLPQISSNMWSRGFGQLVRARNIKTVGDLSALTPSEIKTLPIRSPKISNVKKALKGYEQQRKGRGGDELKSLAEMEMMTSELEEAGAPQNQDEEDKTSSETLATELVEEPLPADGSVQQGDSGTETPGTHAERQQAPPTVGQLHRDGLLSEVEALNLRMTPLELGHISPQQLVEMHDQLGGMMSRVVGELQARLCQKDGKT